MRLKFIGYRQVALLLAVGTICSLPGCRESRVPVFPVSGKVTFKGRPPVGATVLLHPVHTAPGTNIIPTGIVSDDGSFHITSYETGDGAPAGDYVATIEWYKFDPKIGGTGPNVLPKQYAQAKASPVKVNVSGAPLDIPPITIQ